MLASLVLLVTFKLGALSHASTPVLEWVHCATYTLQLLASLEKRLLNTSVAFQIYLQTPTFLIVYFTGSGYFNFNGVMSRSVMKLRIFVTSLAQLHEYRTEIFTVLSHLLTLLR